MLIVWVVGCILTGLFFANTINDMYGGVQGYVDFLNQHLKRADRPATPYSVCASVFLASMIWFVIVPWIIIQAIEMRR